MREAGRDLAQGQVCSPAVSAATRAGVVCARGESAVRAFGAAFHVLRPTPLQPGPCLTQPDHVFSFGRAPERSRRGEGAAGKSH